ncbi:putative cadmium-transporting ATPase [Phycisphaerae bacterium RAS1]|nr:putative cadmium-transporting ATPase [Phycisphaerae bacterium RAS1]
MRQLDLKIDGMDCAEEIAALRAALGPLSGIQKIDFNLLERRMTVQFTPEQVGDEAIIRAVQRTGLRATPFREAAEYADDRSLWRRRGRTLMTAVSGVLLVAGFVAHVGAAGWRTAIGEHALSAIPLVVRCVYVLAAVAGAWFVLPKAWFSLRRLRPDMNLLMTIAVTGALAIGEYFEAAAVAFLFALSLALEAWSVGRARRAIAALMSLTPPQARVVQADGNETLVDVADVPVGGRFVLKPGEKVPLDGRIVTGQTTVDQSPITGESLPVSKQVGDLVFAGSLNHDGAIEVESVKPASESTVSQIIKLVREAQSRRSPAERWVETFARYYTPAVLALAVIVGAVVPLMVGNWSAWFYQALVLLVIACPCALVISTPVSIVAALASAARHGVLIKGGEFVELPARLKAIALDKTGTLTQGRPAVRDAVPLSGHTEAELLEIAAAIELRSEHPLAQAIVSHAKARGIRPLPVQDYQALKGKGATALLNGRSVWIGSHRYLEERGEETPELHDQLEAMSGAGSSVVVVGEDGHVCGLIALADQLRPDASAVVQDLRAAGIEHVIMLTGDNTPTAKAIAQASGIDEFRAELRPEDKVTAIEELVQRYGTVGMIGDGVNDAPALARASVGFAMGAIGTDAAIETADIALMSDDLSRVPWLIRHSRRALRIVRQNIVASLAIKAAFIGLTLLGHASLWAAIAADMGVSLLVVGNALRLLSDVAQSDSAVGISIERRSQ